MSTPRPSEADVEALAEALRQIDAAGSVQTYERHARAILASDWLAARGAEHEREVAALRSLCQTVIDVHAQVVMDTPRDRDLHERAIATFRAHLALFPRDDAAGAGGAG